MGNKEAQTRKGKIGKNKKEKKKKPRGADPEWPLL